MASCRQLMTWRSQRRRRTPLWRTRPSSARCVTKDTSLNLTWLFVPGIISCATVSLPDRSRGACGNLKASRVLASVSQAIRQLFRKSPLRCTPVCAQVSQFDGARVAQQRVAAAAGADSSSSDEVHIVFIEIAIHQFSAARRDADRMRASNSLTAACRRPQHSSATRIPRRLTVVTGCMAAAAQSCMRRIPHIASSSRHVPLRPRREQSKPQAAQKRLTL